MRRTKNICIDIQDDCWEKITIFEERSGDQNRKKSLINIDQFNS